MAFALAELTRRIGIPPGGLGRQIRWARHRASTPCHLRDHFVTEPRIRRTFADAWSIDDTAHRSYRGHPAEHAARPARPGRGYPVEAGHRQCLGGKPDLGGRTAPSLRHR